MFKWDSLSQIDWGLSKWWGRVGQTCLSAAEGRHTDVAETGEMRDGGGGGLAEIEMMYITFITQFGYLRRVNFRHAIEPGNGDNATQAGVTSPEEFARGLKPLNKHHLVESIELYLTLTCKAVSSRTVFINKK